MVCLFSDFQADVRVLQFMPLNLVSVTRRLRVECLLNFVSVKGPPRRKDLVNEMSMRRNYKFRPPLDKRFSTSNSNEMKKRKSNLEDLEERIFFLVEISLRWTCFRAVGHAPNWNGLEAVEAKRKTHQEIIR